MLDVVGFYMFWMFILAKYYAYFVLFYISYYINVLYITFGYL
jgi:hypothetical protein